MTNDWLHSGQRWWAVQYWLGRHIPFKALKPKNLFRAQSLFILKLSRPLISFCCQWRNIIKHISVLFWTGPCKEVVWSLYLCCLFLASVVARSPHDHVSLCRPTPPPAERGLSPRTVPGPGLAHTHKDTHKIFSPSPIFSTKKKRKRKPFLHSLPRVVKQRYPFLWADLKHVVARDLDRYISPINICSPGLLSTSFQKATAYTLISMYIHAHSHPRTHTYTTVHLRLTIKDSWFWTVSGQLDSHRESPNYRRLAHRQTLREHIYGQTLNAICQSL